VAGDFDFPFFKDDQFNSYMQKFLYSFKNIYSENINTRNLLFLTGPTKAGKSWYLRYNLRKFQASGQNPIVLYYDMRDQGMVSFDMFLHSFEMMVIDTLSIRNKDELARSKKSLISEADILKKVVFRFYDESLFE
jgi:chromosomal replication initiation ATPase DnaA